LKKTYGTDHKVNISYSRNQAIAGQNFNLNLTGNKELFDYGGDYSFSVGKDFSKNNLNFGTKTTMTASIF
jgi:hypothetical protein